MCDYYHKKVYDYNSISNEKYDRPDEKLSKSHNSYKGLKNKEYDELYGSFSDFLYEGLINLAKNEETNLQIEEVNQKWNQLFKPILKEILDLLERLRNNIEFCELAISVEGKNLENIKEILKKCNDELNLMCKDAIQITDLDSESDTNSGLSTDSSLKYGSFLDSDFGFELDSDSNMEELMESVIDLTKLYVVNEQKRKKDKK